jgi:hypothetical protein
MQTTGGGGFSPAGYRALFEGPPPVGAPGDAPRRAPGRRGGGAAAQAVARRARHRAEGLVRCVPGVRPGAPDRRRLCRGPAPGPGALPGGRGAGWRKRRGRFRPRTGAQVQGAARAVGPAKPIGRRAGNGVNLDRQHGARSPGGPGSAPWRGRAAPAAGGDGRLDLTPAQASEADPAGGQADDPRPSCRRCGRCRCRTARPAKAPESALPLFARGACRSAPPAGGQWLNTAESAWRLAARRALPAQRPPGTG